MPSRLKGIETLSITSVVVNAATFSRLNVPSRLKGIETSLKRLVQRTNLPRLNVPSRLKGIETLR